MYFLCAVPRHENSLSGTPEKKSPSSPHQGTQLQGAAMEQNTFVMNNPSGVCWAEAGHLALLLVKGWPRSVVVWVIIKRWAAAWAACVGTCTPHGCKSACSSGRGGRRWHGQASVPLGSGQSCWEGV